MDCRNVEDVGATWKSPANPGMDVSNPVHMDVIDAAILGFWVPAFPAGTTQVERISNLVGN
jgi:hypothetical protein